MGEDDPSHADRTMQEVAELALFLASDKAGAITGAAYTIDLGWMAR